MSARGRVLLLVTLTLLLAGILVMPAGATPWEQATSIRNFLFPGRFNLAYSGAGLEVNQRGAGSILNLQDGGASEYTFDQAGATFVNGLNMSNALITNIGNAGSDFVTGGGLTLAGAATFNGAVAFNGAVTGAVSNSLAGAALTLNTPATTTLQCATPGLATFTLPATGTLQVTTGNFRVGNGSNSVTLNGEDAYVEGTFEVDGTSNFLAHMTVLDDILIGSGTPTITQNGGDVYVTDQLEVDGEAQFDGAIDANGASNFAAASVFDGTSTFNGVTTILTDTAHIGVPVWDRATVITSTNGALWTIPIKQKWVVEAVFCQITTNFDCTGDDCALIIGDDADTDGFLVLADAAMQAADTEGTGWPAGWEGFAAATIGAYLDGIGFFMYDQDAAAQTIDIDIRDASDASNPTAGAAQCFLKYTRIE